MVIELILAALALTAASSAVVAIRRRSRQEKEAPPALTAPRSLSQGELVPNDVITHLESDYLVEGVATLREGGRVVLVVAWMTDGGSTRSLLIDLVEQPRCTLAEAQDASVYGSAIPSWVDSEGYELRLSRKAAVRINSDGHCGLLAQGSCEYGIYRGPGNRKAALLVSNKDTYLWVGQGVTEAGLVLLPGKGV